LNDPVDTTIGHGWQGITQVLRVLGTNVKSARAFDDGHLELHFEGGSKFLVPASQEFESWTCNGPRDVHVVSLPGGNLAVWSSSDLVHIPNDS
jgi:hypothetical protein